MHMAAERERGENRESGMSTRFEYKCTNVKHRLWLLYPTSVYILPFSPFCNSSSLSPITQSCSLIFCFNTFLCSKTGHLPFTDPTVLILSHGFIIFHSSREIFFCPILSLVGVSVCVCVCLTCLYLWAPYSSRRISPECAAFFCASSSFCDSHKSLIRSSSPPSSSSLFTHS